MQKVEHTSQSAILIVAGEPSGDSHGAHLVQKLRQAMPYSEFTAMGLSKLSAAGANLIVNAEELAVVGFVDVFLKLTKIVRAFRRVLRFIKKTPPKIMILIDYPGFNLRLAKAVKKINPSVKVIYYISPQLWAWRYQRMETIKQYVDHMAVILPFEVEMYQRENIPVHYVGNPLIDQVQTSLLPNDRRKYFGFDNAQQTIIGLMPGSRESEIRFILPTLIDSARRLQQELPDVHFLIPVAPNIKLAMLKPYLETLPFPITLVENLHYDAISLCDAVIVASGTATLEVALLNKPMVIVYKSSKINMAIAKRVVNVTHIGLCNIVAEKTIVKEFIQDQATPDQISHEVKELLFNLHYREQVITSLKMIRDKLVPTSTLSLDKIVLAISEQAPDLNY